MIKKILIIFLFICLYKIISNFVNYKYLCKIENEYITWLSSKNKNPNLTQCKNKVISLFKKANVSNCCIPLTQPTGFGKCVTTRVSVFENFPSPYENFASIHFNMITVAKGTYKQRALETFNPLFWIDLVLFAPKNILEYIGLNDETTLFKALNIVLTFFWWLFGIIINLFNTEIHNFIIKLFT